MKKKYLLLLIIPILLFSGCKSDVEKTTICKKTLPYTDTQIDWKNEIEIKTISGIVDDITVREIITVDPSVDEERIASFRDSEINNTVEEMMDDFIPRTFNNDSEKKDVRNRFNYIFKQRIFFKKDT